MAQVLALVDDLFFQAKMLETARHVGVELRTCATADALVGEIAKEAPNLVVVDLNARSGPIAAIERMQTKPRGFAIVAFLSHVQVELAEQAKAAGCSAVMPRSQFTRDLATILTQAKSQL
jgi:AmiR/NasT family two-component response regulator